MSSSFFLSTQRRIYFKSFVQQSIKSCVLFMEISKFSYLQFSSIEEDKKKKWFIFYLQFKKCSHHQHHCGLKKNHPGKGWLIFKNDKHGLSCLQKRNSEKDGFSYDGAFIWFLTTPRDSIHFFVRANLQQKIKIKHYALLFTRIILKI